MKLVEILAKEWKEWPHNCDHAVCDSDGEIRAIGTGTHHDFYPSGAVDVDDRLSGTALLVSHDGKTVTRADWEKEKMKKAAPKKNVEGWIRHRGGKCPVDSVSIIDVKWRGGDIVTAKKANTFDFSHDGGMADVMYYRLHKPAEQTISDDDVIDLCVACADDEPAIVEGPLQWRDRIAEIDATSLALTTERAELVQKLASEGFALI